MANDMDVAVDIRQFRQTIGLFATGVTVIAAEVEGEIHAMTANAVSSLSLDPMLVLFCLGKGARMASFCRQATTFSINILRDEQQALSNYFAGAWREEVPPPFRFVPWEGCPRLQGCLAALACHRTHFLEGGDHWIVIGRVVALHQGVEPRRPLLFYSGRYAHLGSVEIPAAPDWSQAEDVPIQLYYDPWQQDE